MNKEVVIELFGENSHIHVSKVPEDVQVKILDFPHPSQSRIIYSDLSVKYLNPSEVFSASHVLPRQQIRQSVGILVAMFPNSNLRQTDFRRITGHDALYKLLGGSHDHLAILDNYVLYVPILGNNSNLKIVTKCDDFGKLVDLNPRDFENIREILEEIIC